MSTDFKHSKGSTCPQIISFCKATWKVVTLMHFQDEVQLSALAQDLVRLDKLSAAAWYLIKYTKDDSTSNDSKQSQSVLCVSAHCLSKVRWWKLLFSPEGA